MSFLRSMGSAKNMLLTEHGKHFFEFCDTSAVKRPLCFGIYTAEGCNKLKNRILTEHGKQKKGAPYGAWEASF